MLAIPSSDALAEILVVDWLSSQGAGASVDQFVLRAGGGYTDLAIVAEVHPITHPPKTKKIVHRASSLAWVPTTSNMTAQTIPQPIV
jgi:hypothetical protein